MKADQVQHILVDEFQDTSAGQVSLLEQLTAGWEPGDGRTLFCVGDAMQSIYGFRGANVGLFIHVREQGLKTLALEPLRLTANFRSQAGIVDWVNRIFSRAFPSVSEVSTGAVEYAESTAIQDKLEGRAATIHGFVDHANYEMEALYVRGIIRKTRSENPNASIAILLRSRDYGAHILPVLKEAGLSYRAVDLEPLRDHAIIQDLMALTRALLHRADRTAWLSVLRAPWCGLNLVDLETLANSRINEKQLPTVLEQCQLVLSENLSSNAAASEQSDFFVNVNNAETRLSHDGRQRLERVLPTLQLALENSGRRGFRQWVEGTWLALGGPAAAENSAALNNAERFFELLEQWPYAHDLEGFEQLEKKIAKLYAKPDPESDESLQVMTIHKSKGLEFDVVIIPSLQRKPRPDASAMLLWHERLNDEGERDLLMAPLTRQGKQLHPSYAYLRREQAQKQRYEDTRLLYVACTRAKQQLHLMAFLKRDPKESARLKHPIRSSLMASIWPAVEQRIRIVEPKQTEAELLASTEVFRPRPLHRLVSDWQAPEMQRVCHLADFIPSFDYDNEEAPEAQWQSPSPRHVGTLVHAYMQRFAEQGLDSWSMEKLDQQRPAIELMLKHYGVPASELKNTCERVVLSLNKVIEDPLAERILKNYEYSFSEFALTCRGKYGPESVVIDRVYKDENAVLWIVDYKIAEPAEGQSLEAFLAQEGERYDPQLRRYRRVMSELAPEIGHRQIRCALYFPLLSKLDIREFN
jgi:ATP-dependent helicase/nuclease subunit A